MHLSKSQLIKTTIRNQNLSPRARHFLQLLILDADINGICHIDRTGCASKMNVSLPCFVRYIKELKAGQWIEDNGHRQSCRLNMQTLTPKEMCVQGDDSYVLID
ncbi:hypothetical protein [Sansalvadorimonas verongulae]|uniref:hypothetical protein n=1 Tax=Sansalvadorimonas verongulae TaxID=2172824 RepID=UPI0012BC16BD|nr:hypothetical protein [Sansalvadorimonas verongulae]MTI12416.1 hypothetical protein [Sansalvadorimonas verongulae]